MNISCAICGDIFTGLNPEESVCTTICGHLFHYTCLLEWFERSKTCPQCRHKTTEKNVIRIFFNNANVSSDNEDPSVLKFRVDSLEFQLKYSEKEIKLLKEEKNAALSQNKGLRKEIKEMSSKSTSNEQKLLNAIDEVKTLRHYCKQLSEVQLENEELKKEIDSCKSINSIINGTVDEAKSAVDNMGLSVEQLQQCVKYLRERIKDLESEHRVTEKEVLFYQRKAACQNKLLKEVQGELQSVKRIRENSFILVSDDDSDIAIFDKDESSTHKENVHNNTVTESPDGTIKSPLWENSSHKKVVFSKPKPLYQSKNTLLLGVAQPKSQFRIPKLSSSSSSTISSVGDDEYHPTKYYNAEKPAKRSKKKLSATDISAFKKKTSSNKSKITGFIEIK